MSGNQAPDAPDHRHLAPSVLNEDSCPIIAKFLGLLELATLIRVSKRTHEIYAKLLLRHHDVALENVCTRLLIGYFPLRHLFPRTTRDTDQVFDSGSLGLPNDPAHRLHHIPPRELFNYIHRFDDMSINLYMGEAPEDDDPETYQEGEGYSPLMIGIACLTEEGQEHMRADMIHVHLQNLRCLRHVLHYTTEQPTIPNNDDEPQFTDFHTDRYVSLTHGGRTWHGSLLLNDPNDETSHVSSFDFKRTHIAQDAVITFVRTVVQILFPAIAPDFPMRATHPNLPPEPQAQAGPAAQAP